MIIKWIKTVIQRRVFKDTSYVAIAQFITIGIGFITSIVFARNLGLEGFGQYNLLMVYIALAKICGLPGMNVVIRKGVLKGYDPIFKLALRKSIYFASFCSLFIVLLSVIIYSINLITQEAFISFLVIASFTVLSGLDKYDNLLQAKKAFFLSRKIMVLSSFLTLCLVGGTAYYTKSFIFVICALFFVRLLTIIYGLYISNKLIIPMNDDIFKQQLLFEESKKYTMFSLFNIGVGQLDKLIIGLIDPKLLAIYSVGSFIPRKIKDNIKTLISVPVMHMGSMSKEKNLYLLKKHGAKLFLFGFFLTVIIWATVPWFIPYFYGKEYHNAVWIAQVLSLSLGFNLLGLMLLNYDIYQNRGNFYRKQLLIRQLVYVALVAIAISYYGIYGLVFSIVFVEIIFSLIIVFITKHKNTLQT